MKSHGACGHFVILVVSFKGLYEGAIIIPVFLVASVTVSGNGLNRLIPYLNP